MGPPPAGWTDPGRTRRRLAWMSVGALVAGLVLVGASLVLLGQVEQQELSCLNRAPGPSNCQSTVDAAENNSVTYEGMLGVGIITAGVGAGLICAVLIDILARREVDFPLGPPAPGPASGSLPGASGLDLTSPPPPAPSPPPTSPPPPSPPLT